MMRILLTVAVLSVAVVTLAGCTLGENKPSEPVPDTPMPTASPVEVVIKVPGMTCESCVEKVTAALASIPWVEAGSITTDRKARQARFAVTDVKQFDFPAVEEAVRSAGYSGTTLLTPPGPAAR